MWIVSFPGSMIEDVRFIDCTFRGVEATEVLQNVDSISFKHITIEPAKKLPTRNSSDELAIIAQSIEVQTYKS